MLEKHPFFTLALVFSLGSICGYYGELPSKNVAPGRQNEIDYYVYGDTLKGCQGKDLAAKADTQAREVIAAESVEKAVEYPADTLAGFHRYPFNLLRVVDGDTIDGDWLIWRDMKRSGRIRLLGVNTPELRPKSGTIADREYERENALAAKAFVEATLREAVALYVVTDWKADSFGRTLAYVEYQDASGTVRNLSSILLEKNLAKPFTK